MHDYHVEGFPTVMLTDAGGNPYARTGYRPGGANVYIQHLETLQTQGQKVQTLLSSKNDARSMTLRRAFPVLVQHDLLGYPGYAPLLREARQVDPDGSKGLKRYVDAYEETTRLGELFAPIYKRLSEQSPSLESIATNDTDFSKLHAFLKKSRYVGGRQFVDSTWITAEWLRKHSRFAEAKELYERLLRDPSLIKNREAVKTVRKFIRKCEAKETE